MRGIYLWLSFMLFLDLVPKKYWFQGMFPPLYSERVHVTGVLFYFLPKFIVYAHCIRVSSGGLL